VTAVNPKNIFSNNLALLTLWLCCVVISTANAHGIQAEQARVLAHGGPFDYFKAGAIHMLTGYDHLLFLFGVMFFLTSFKDIVKFITAFTLGHSLTLIEASIFEVQANYLLIDAAIAISVLYKGFDNLDGFRRWFGVPPPNLLGMVFGFGLIHGFGLATRLQQIGLPMNDLMTLLLSFNAGVEVGQIAALVAMTALLALFRGTSAFGPFTIIANTFLMIAGSLLFLLQMHGYLHTTYPNEFGFSTKSHILDHFKNDIPSGDDIPPPKTSPPKSEIQPPSN
jgi:hypothetical protein